MSVTRRAFLEIAGGAAVGVRLGAQNRVHALEPGPNGKVLKDPAGRVDIVSATDRGLFVFWGNPRRSSATK